MSYKDVLLVVYHHEVRNKTTHFEVAPDAVPNFFRKKRRVRVRNASVRPVVKKRLKKLNKYVKRAWYGYKEGVLQ
jgi:hypothetical protein